MTNSKMLIAAAASLALGTAPAIASAKADPVKSILLVHGGFVDGSGWQGVYEILKKDGYDVTIVQNPTNSLADDVAVTKRAIAAAPGKVILVGHSYGGMVITGVADRAADRISELVYLDAAHPRDGESLAIVAPAQMEPTYAGVRVVDGVELVMWPFPGMAQFFGITDPADAAWTESKLTPHPWKCFAQPLTLRNGDAAARLKRTNINCTASLGSSPGEARARQLEGDRNFEIDTGHDLMITEPEAVTGLLLQVAG